MSQDLREMFREDRDRKYSMKAGHEERFMNKLDEAMPAKAKPRFYFLKIAASLLLLFGIGAYFLINSGQEEPANTQLVEKQDEPDAQPGISLGDLSPDLKKIENYYVANINLELSRLKVSNDNKALVDSFMERLAELNEEYRLLNEELNTIGPNDQTIAALIQNLQLRLELLQKLKLKLNELKSSENEQVTAISI